MKTVMTGKPDTNHCAQKRRGANDMGSAGALSLPPGALAFASIAAL